MMVNISWHFMFVVDRRKARTQHKFFLLLLLIICSICWVILVGLCPADFSTSSLEHTPSPSLELALSSSLSFFPLKDFLDYWPSFFFRRKCLKFLVRSARSLSISSLLESLTSSHALRAMLFILGGSSSGRSIASSAIKEPFSSSTFILSMSLLSSMAVTLGLNFIVKTFKDFVDYSVL
eukprot:TRINITY_DN4103_c0_g1_i3.p1 TRINITY_DN4103_c0_g1~~TRINITY_DN4103_c0_g1_i3.p1  ORF type:complete len:179 (+),score=13.43 TRINITY_DN4103_c0_g1_i3:143-679(+)